MKKLLLLSLTLVLAGTGCRSAPMPVLETDTSDFDKETTCIGLAQGHTNPNGNDFVLLDSCYDKDLDTCIAIIRETDPNGSLFYSLDINHNEILEEWYNGSSGQYGSTEGLYKHCE